MASIQEKFQFSEKTDKEIFKAAILDVPQAGLKVWKTRELARLVLAQGEYNGETSTLQYCSQHGRQKHNHYCRIRYSR